MEEEGTPPARKRWMIRIAIGWLLFSASSLLLDITIFPETCYDFEPYPYWLATEYEAPALIGFLGTLPLGVVAVFFHERRYVERVPTLFYVLMFGAMLFSCGGLVSIFFGTPDHIKSLRVDARVYHLTICTDDPDYSNVFLYECRLAGFDCEAERIGSCYGAGTLVCEGEFADGPVNTILVKLNDETVYMIIPDQ